MPQGQPQVSVVMAVFNSPQLLQRTIDSVLAQEEVELEFMVVDDGCDEPTRELLGRYAEQGLIELERQDNQGITRALIAGCSKVSYEFIARIDVGDEMAPGRLKEQATLLCDQPAAGLVCSNLVLHSPEGEFLTEQRFCVEHLCKSIRSPLSDGAKIPAHSSTMFRASFYKRVGGYRPQFYFAQDLDLWSRLIEVSDIALLEAPLTKVMISATGISGLHAKDQARSKELIAELINARANQLPEGDLLAKAAAIQPADNKTRESLFAGNYFLGKWLLDKRSPFAMRYLFTAICAKPWSVKAWWAWLKSSVHGSVKADT